MASHHKLFRNPEKMLDKLIEAGFRSKDTNVKDALITIRNQIDFLKQLKRHLKNEHTPEEAGDTKA